MHKSNGTSAARGLCAMKRPAKRTQMKSDNFIGRQRHRTQSLIPDGKVLLFYTNGFDNGIARVCLISSPVILNDIYTGYIWVAYKLKRKKTSFSLIVVQIFWIRFVSFIWWSKPTHWKCRQGVVLGVHAPAGRTADSFIHSSVHSAIHSLRLRFTYPFIRHFWQTFEQNCISIYLWAVVVVVERRRTLSTIIGIGHRSQFDLSLSLLCGLWSGFCGTYVSVMI